MFSLKSNCRDVPLTLLCDNRKKLPRCYISTFYNSFLCTKNSSEFFVQCCSEARGTQNRYRHTKQYIYGIE